MTSRKMVDISDVTLGYKEEAFLPPCIETDRGCRTEVALLDRLVQARSARPWSDWLSTHPTPADRLEAVREFCPG